MRSRKRIVYLHLLLVLTLFLTAIKIDPVKANPIRVAVDYYGSPNVFDTALIPGKRFTINITVDYVQELWAYQVEISFNASILRGIEYVDGGFLGIAGGNTVFAAGQGFDNVNGKLNLFTTFLFPKTNLPTGGGTLARITFEVVGTGGSPLTFGKDAGLANATGGWWLYPDYAKNPIHKLENPGVFTDGYFDNRPPLYLTPALVKGIPFNGNFTISANVSNMTDLYSYNFYIYWNSSILDAVEVAEGDFLKDQPGGTEFHYTMNNAGGYLQVDSSAMGASGVSGQGTLANITFLVKGVGSSPIRLKDVVLRGSPPELQPIKIRTADSQFLKIHDIAITGITVSPSSVKAGSGELVTITVTLSNIGGFDETNINVTAYYGENIISNQTVASLAMGDHEILTYTWNTSGISRGKYIIKAVASKVPEEASTKDNTLAYGTYSISSNDIAIVNVTPAVTQVFVGRNVTITVVVVNLGTELENFNVTVFCNATRIETQTLTAFGYGQRKSLKFIWNTAGVALGSYIVSAEATTVSGEENLDDNYYIQLSMVRVLPPLVEEISTELYILTAVPIVFIGVAVLFYLRTRKKRGEISEGFPTSY